MSEKRTSLEMIASSIEEAVEKGLEELGLTEQDVDIEVLDSGSKGLFGLGSRQARIRLMVKSGQVSGETPGVPAIPLPMPMPMPVGEAASVHREPETGEVSGGQEEDEALRTARVTVLALMEKMNIKAKATARYKESDEPQGRKSIWVDIRGDDLSILIGPKAETLNAFQYIASQIVNKDLDHPVSLLVDVQGFRARREVQIRQLARKMAEQAIKTGRRQILEPMAASERRLVHIELRSNPSVTTESIGEDPHRKVTIIPKL
jgi:spoIIIJ-associated protein